MENKIILTTILALALLVPTLSTQTTQVFAVHEESKQSQQNNAYFNIIVKGFDVSKDYRVCYGTWSQECHDYSGAQLNTPIKFALIQPVDYRIHACVRDLSTQALACEDFKNTSKNPENVTVTAISEIPVLKESPQTQAQTTIVEDEEAGGSGDDGKKSGDDSLEKMIVIQMDFQYVQRLISKLHVLMS
jgi:hypothetical protein